jgi:excinuclease ABC subunit B
MLIYQRDYRFDHNTDHAGGADKNRECNDTILLEAGEYESEEEIEAEIGRLEKEMKEAASRLEFERAAEIRDKIHRLEEMELKMR